MSPWADKENRQKKKGTTNQMMMEREQGRGKEWLTSFCNGK